MELYQKLWYFTKNNRTVIYQEKNYGTLGKNYGNMEKTIVNYSKL